MFLFGYIIETLILYVWLKTIVKSELKNNNINERNIIRRTIKLIYDNKKIIMCNLFGWVQYNEEKKKNVENVKKYIINLFVPIVLCCPVYLLTPIFASCFLKKNILCIILYSVIITEIIIDGLKKYTQNFLNSLIAYIRNVLIPLEKNNSLIIPEEKDCIKIKWEKKTRACICIGIIVLLFLECVLILILKIKGSREAKFFSITVLLFICLKEYSKSNNHKNCENISFESVDFALIEDDIKEVCKKLKIGNIKFKVEKEDINNVLVKIDDNGNYEIIVFQGFLNFLIYINQINGGNIREMFLVTICHELGHIYYDDLKKYIKRVRWSCIIFWLSIVVNLFLLPEILNMIFVFFCWCIGGVMCDIRYWKQIAELKADRLAVDKCENGRRAFIDIWGNEKKIEEDRLRINEIEKYNKIYKYYKRYIEKEAHPLMERRVYLVKNRGAWKWWEYIEHALLIRKWYLIGKGWNGR